MKKRIHILKKNKGMGLIFALVISLCVASFATFLVNDLLQNQKMIKLISLRYTVQKLRKSIINIPFINITRSMSDTYNSQINNCYEHNMCSGTSTFKPFKLLAPDGSTIGSGEGVFYNSDGWTCADWSTHCPIKLTLKARISGGQLFIKYEIEINDTVGGHLSDLEGTIPLSVDYIKQSEDFILSCNDPKQLVGVNTDGTPICIPPKYKDVYLEIDL